jgi:hypothetical protein
MFSVIPDDTDPATWHRLEERMRALSPGEKARMVGELNASVRAAALAGIRRRHPEATEREQRLYLAALLIDDDELMKRAFGWDAAVRGR